MMFYRSGDKPAMARSAAPLLSRRSLLAALMTAALVMALAILSAGPAAAGSLDTAKARGDVGEGRDGYIGIVISSPPADLVRLVDDINLRRRDAYRRVVDKTPGATLAAVEKLAGAKLINNASSGTYIESGSGGWVKKP